MIWLEYSHSDKSEVYCLKSVAEMNLIELTDRSLKVTVSTDMILFYNKTTNKRVVVVGTPEQDATRRPRFWQSTQLDKPCVRHHPAKQLFPLHTVRQVVTDISKEGLRVFIQAPCTLILPAYCAIAILTFSATSSRHSLSIIMRCDLEERA